MPRHGFVVPKISRVLTGTTLVLLSAACESPTRMGSNSAEVRVDSTLYHAPSAVRVVARNTGTVTWTTGNCGLRLQRQTASEWFTVAVDPVPGQGCDLVIRYVQPGGVLTRWINLSANADPGVYRVIVEDINPELPEESRTSQTFQVTSR